LVPRTGEPEAVSLNSPLHAIELDALPAPHSIIGVTAGVVLNVFVVTPEPGGCIELVRDRLPPAGLASVTAYLWDTDPRVAAGDPEIREMLSQPQAPSSAARHRWQSILDQLTTAAPGRPASAN
jgi:hypothetical protein